MPIRLESRPSRYLRTKRTSRVRKEKFVGLRVTSFFLGDTIPVLVSPKILARVNSLLMKGEGRAEVVCAYLTLVYREAEPRIQGDMTITENDLRQIRLDKLPEGRTSFSLRGRSVPKIIKKNPLGD